MQAMDVSCKELRSRAWNRLKSNYWNSLGASVLGNFIAGICAIFTAGAMSYGLVSYYVDQQRGKNAEFTQIFDGFNNYGRSFVGWLLQYLFILLWSLIPVVGFIIGGIIKPLSYGMTFYVMRDFNLEGNDAITKSKELMNGYKWKLFKLRLSFIGWFLLCMVTFCIGTFFLLPYIDATMAEFYAELLHCHNMDVADEASVAE